MDTNATRVREDDGVKYAVKKMEFIDREWYDREDKRIIGDMGFSFEDSPDTRTTELGTLAESIKEYAGDEMVGSFGWDRIDTKEDDIPIYYVFQADFEDEMDDDEDANEHQFREWNADMVEETRKCVFIGVYASEEEAKALGIDKELKECYPDCEITYFNPKVEIAKYLAEVEKNKADAIESVM